MTISQTVSQNDISLRSIDDYSDDDWDLNEAQSISGRNIDPEKLTMLLRIKFGAGAYDVHIMQGSYCVVAPRKLSTGEIARCRRR
ncbi:hypothetical protein NX059_002866 [Plenodomus lindquistii]|nr:hypothetical protein NX059_002866 [Plenodomus lindquistii]